MSDNKIRLSKLMTERGLCSRRKADEWIEKGWVMVNGIPVTQLGTKVDPLDRITLSAEAMRLQKQMVTVILNKPVGWVSAQPEEGYHPAIELLSPENFEGPGPAPLDPRDLTQLAVAGRLDIDSQGLLVFTQDGRIAKQLIGENSEVEKEYLVRVEGKLPPSGLELLCYGLQLDGKKLKPAKVEWLNQDQLRFVLKEGRKRQVRRMCEAVGLHVCALKRVRVGKMLLGKLPEGKWRLLGTSEKF